MNSQLISELLNSYVNLWVSCELNFRITMIIIRTGRALEWLQASIFPCSLFPFYLHNYYDCHGHLHPVMYDNVFCLIPPRMLVHHTYTRQAWPPLYQMCSWQACTGTACKLISPAPTIYVRSSVKRKIRKSDGPDYFFLFFSFLWVMCPEVSLIWRNRCTPAHVLSACPYVAIKAIR